VTLKQTAPTTMEVLLAPAGQDTPETDSPAQVSRVKRTLLCKNRCLVDHLHVPQRVAV